MGTRSSAERDAITVEIGFALLSAGFVAVAAFLGLAAPTWFLDLPHPVDLALFFTGGVVAVIAFVARVVHVLWRFSRRPAAPQAELPGRTRA
ncbi:hypothetical protein QR77_02645 [Streptomyces sp. 150FB]|uniref:DUF6332 family protein n=1 Tax=Streptomyces sp. 150FB TaxID=1576605 RepID=UPI000589003D|nr:DUF6332 family protein [Streptomyces sp. 150FB]KIF73175.1 hypothetical protein QR77_02645 [Streptomyces sp. 150FB]